MSLRLAMDASAGGASIALLRDHVCVDECTLDRHGSAEALAPAVDAMLTAAGVTVRALDGIVVGGGPGSFTGIRVVAALAKGLSYASGVPLFAVNSLALIASGMPDAREIERSTCSVLDALRGEWFLQRVNVRAGSATCVGAVERLRRADCEALAAQEGRTLVGPVIDGAQLPHARGVALLAPVGVDLASWEPEYGRLAEAQVVWEAAHGRPLPAA